MCVRCFAVVVLPNDVQLIVLLMSHVMTMLMLVFSFWYMGRNITTTPKNIDFVRDSRYACVEPNQEEK